MALKNNTWKLNQWYDQDVAGNVSYSTTLKELYTWGAAGQGRLGINLPQNQSRSSPTQIPGTTWRSVSCDAGAYNVGFSLATRTDGTLWAWGGNWQGNLGQNSIGNPSDMGLSSPTQIPGTTWSGHVTVSQHASSAVKTDGTLWMWGYNTSGQLGQNNRTSYSSPVQVPGTTWTTTEYVNDGNWAGFLLGKTDGTMWGIGSNGWGDLGQNNTTSYSSPVQIPGTWSDARAASSSMTCATKTDGTLWTWGNGSDGRLGLNAEGIHYSSPVQIGSDTDWGITAGKVSSTSYSGIAIKTDGTMWAWGKNNKGQLGLNNVVYRSSPTQIPGTTWATVTGDDDTLIAVKTDGTAWGWGDNSYGEVGVNDKTDYSSPTQIPGAWDVVKSAGSERMLGLKLL